MLIWLNLKAKLEIFVMNAEDAKPINWKWIIPKNTKIEEKKYTLKTKKFKTKEAENIMKKTKNGLKSINEIGMLKII